MGLFLKDVRYNTLPDGTKSNLPQIYCDFILSLKKEVLDNVSELEGLANEDNYVPLYRIMWAHGTPENHKRFVFLEAGINRAKASYWQGSLDRIPAKEIEDETDKALMKIRHTLNVFSYLSNTIVNTNFAEICNLIRTEFGRAEAAWVKKGNKASGIVKYWDAWIRSHQKAMAARGIKFIDDQVDTLEKYWYDKLVSNDDCDRERAADVLQKVSTLKRQKPLVVIDLSRLD
ncbi:hypothetical protein ACHAPQ_011627 [Fusarium lateritium]